MAQHQSLVERYFADDDDSNLNHDGMARTGSVIEEKTPSSSSPTNEHPVEVSSDPNDFRRQFVRGLWSPAHAKKHSVEMPRKARPSSDSPATLRGIGGRSKQLREQILSLYDMALGNESASSGETLHDLGYETEKSPKSPSSDDQQANNAAAVDARKLTDTKSRTLLLESRTPKNDRQSTAILQRSSTRDLPISAAIGRQSYHNFQNDQLFNKYFAEADASTTPPPILTSSKLVSLRSQSVDVTEKKPPTVERATINEKASDRLDLLRTTATDADRINSQPPLSVQTDQSLQSRRVARAEKSLVSVSFDEASFLRSPDLLPYSSLDYESQDSPVSFTDFPPPPPSFLQKAANVEDAVDYPVVIGVDLGTRYGGYAYAFRDEHEKIYVMSRYSDLETGLKSQKCRTCLLLNADESFHSFGSAARENFFRLEPSEAQKVYYFEDFKMNLSLEKSAGAGETPVNRALIPATNNGKKLLAVDVFAHCIRQLGRMALDDINVGIEGTFGAFDCLWVVTVPSVWRQGAKQLFREACYKAEIASTYDARSLILVIEPEAAAVFCRTLRVHEMVVEPSSAAAYNRRSKSLPPFGSSATRSDQKTVRVAHVQAGDSYLVIDCGSSGVSVTAHRLSNDGLSLKELLCTSVGAHGSGEVDAAFELLLEDIFSADFIRTFKRENPKSFERIRAEFEAQKRIARGTSSVDNPPFADIHLPSPFIHTYKKQRKHSVECAIRKYSSKQIVWAARDGSLRLSADIMKTLFQRTLFAITDGIRAAFARVERDRSPIRFMFLVGGFAQSPALQDEIRKCFSSLEMKIIIPHEALTASLRGAVIFGLRPSVISVRRARMTYGIGVLNRFRHGEHPPSKKIIKGDIEWCTDVFEPFVVAGQAIEKEERVVRSYCPASLQQEEIVIQVYTSDIENAKFVTDEGVRKCGVLRLRLAPLSDIAIAQRKIEKREIETTMTFAESEIKVTALDLSTGNVVQCDVDFLDVDKGGHS